MRHTFLAALALVVLAGANPGIAQQAPPARPNSPPTVLPTGNGEVRGIITSAEGNTPLANAGVAIRSAKDSVLVAGALTGDDGKFRIRGLRPGSYFLRVTLLGFAPQRRPFTVADATPTHDAGTIALSQVAVALQGVEVTEESPTMTIEPDRNAYRAKDVAPTAANAGDVLNEVPSVQVDGEGKVSLRGNENVAIQINGRPSPLRGPQLAAYLKSLPANIVERVEVVPNPSAKYDPEGMAGIINLVLKQSVDLGMSAGLNAGFAEPDRYNVAGSFGYQAGRLTTFSNLGIYSDDRAIVGINDRERYDPFESLLSVTNQSIYGRSGGTGQNLNTNVDIQLSSRDVLSNVLSINHRNGDDASVSTYTELDDTGDQTDYYNRPRETDTKALMFDYTMAFRRTIEARKHELSSEVRFNRSDDEDQVSIWRQQLDPDGGPSGGRIESENQSTDALTRQFSGQIDYTRPFGSRFKLETGLKSHTRRLDRDFLVMKDTAGTDDWFRSDLSNSFDFDETVHAGYGVLTRNGGKATLQAGLRGERASRNFALADPAEEYPHTYTSLFPSGVVMYNLTKATQLKANYSRRIRRPGTQELNPFPSFFDVQNVFLGNPQLNPEYTDAFEVSWSRTGARGSIQFTPFYRHTTDIIRVDINTADTVENREVTSVSFQNMATANSWGADANGSLRFGQKLNGLASFNVYKMVTDGGSESSIGSSAVTWSGRLNATSQLTTAFIVQASYFYRAPMTIERGRFEAMHGLNLSMRYKLNEDKAVIGLRLADPFNTQKFRVKVGDDNIIQLTERRFGARAAWLTLQLNYGQAPKVRETRPDPTPPPSTPFQ